MDDAQVAMYRIAQPYDEFLANRVGTVSSLFRVDPFSIDAIIVAGTVLTALGFRRYGGRGPGTDQANFERLMLDYWPSYLDRVSIPEVVRFLERRTGAERDQELINKIRRRFTVDLPYSQIRRISDDPTAVEWTAWLEEGGIAFAESRWFSYARIVFRDFRNSVQHRLDIAQGKEARPLGMDRPFFYTNHAGEVRFGFYHPHFEEVLRDVVAGLRSWAVSEQRDIFAR